MIASLLATATPALIIVAIVVVVSLLLGWVAWLRPVTSADGMVSAYDLYEEKRH